MNELKVIDGGLAIDDRGELQFVNGFNPFKEGVQRCYIVKNHKAGFVRAWHSHKLEAKYITVIQGAAIIGAVKIDNWDHPSRDVKPTRYVLSDQKPAILCIPVGYANGFKTLTDNAIVVVYSTATLEESKGDDIRFPAKYWDIWNVEER
jgi:dTDP-4-dehydrorhamnose 3,5-epimerase